MQQELWSLLITQLYGVHVAFSCRLVVFSVRFSLSYFYICVFDTSKFIVLELSMFFFSILFLNEGSLIIGMYFFNYLNTYIECASKYNQIIEDKVTLKQFLQVQMVFQTSKLDIRSKVIIKLFVQLSFGNSNSSWIRNCSFYYFI